MFINELFTGGVRALLDADNTIFDGMVVPSGVSVADVVDNILLHYGDAPLFVTDPAVMKFYITKWSKKRLTQWTRFYKAITTDYNPLENYDRMEDWTNDTEESGASSTSSTSNRASNRAESSASSHDKNNRPALDRPTHRVSSDLP